MKLKLGIITFLLTLSALAHAAEYVLRDNKGNTLGTYSSQQACNDAAKAWMKSNPGYGAGCMKRN